MTLYHKKINRQAIEKYKDRLVYIYHSTLNLWRGNDKWTTEDEKITFTFKNALKLTKLYPESAKIEYHFWTEDAEKFKVEDYENPYENPNLTWELSKRKNCSLQKDANNEY